MVLRACGAPRAVELVAHVDGRGASRPPRRGRGWGPGPLERRAAAFDPYDDDDRPIVARLSPVEVARCFAELVDARERRGAPYLTTHGRAFARVARLVAGGAL